MRLKVKRKLIGLNVRATIYDMVSEVATRLSMSRTALIEQMLETALPSMIQVHQAMKDAAAGEAAKALKRLDKVSGQAHRQFEINFSSRKGGKGKH